MTLFDTDKPKPRKKPPHPRDENWSKLFKLCEAEFYPSGIADGQRARVCKLLDDLRQKGASVANFSVRMSRYRELFPNSVCTLAAMLSQWDTCASVGRTRQPGMPSDAEQAARRRENAMADRELADEQRERDKARLVVQAAPPGAAEKLFKEWQLLPENANLVKHGGGGWCGSPTGTLCVRWIADRLEARNA